MRCPLLDTVDFKNLRRLLKRTRHIKIEVCDLQFSVGSSCHHNSKSGDFTLLFCRGRHGILLKYARAARLFFVIQPIKVSICGVVVVFPAVDAKAIGKLRHVVVWQATKNCAKKRAARAARLFFLIQPLKSLICGVAVAVAFVIGWPPCMKLIYINLVI